MTLLSVLRGLLVLVGPARLLLPAHSTTPTTTSTSPRTTPRRTEGVVKPTMGRLYTGMWLGWDGPLRRAVFPWRPDDPALRACRAAGPGRTRRHPAAGAARHPVDLCRSPAGGLRRRIRTGGRRHAGRPGRADAAVGGGGFLGHGNGGQTRGRQQAGDPGRGARHPVRIVHGPAGPVRRPLPRRAGRRAAARPAAGPGRVGPGARKSTRLKSSP